MRIVIVFLSKIQILGFYPQYVFSTLALLGQTILCGVQTSASQGFSRNPGFSPLGIPGGSVGKESACNVGDLGSISGREKGTTKHSSILAWRIPWTDSPWSCKESDTTEHCP